MLFTLYEKIALAPNARYSSSVYCNLRRKIYIRIYIFPHNVFDNKRYKVRLVLVKWVITVAVLQIEI